jgi:hypothetical protein
MRPCGTLLAWIEPHSDDEFVAAFVGEGAAAQGRAPATQLCSTPADARLWIEGQAAAFALPVKWMGQKPGE